MLSIVDLPQFVDFVEQLMTIGSNRKRKTKVGHVEHRSPPSKCRSPAFQTPRWTKFPLGKLVSSRGKMSSGRWQMDIHLHRILVDLNILNGLEPSIRRYSGMCLSDKYHIFWFYYILLFGFIWIYLQAPFCHCNLWRRAWSLDTPFCGCHAEVVNAPTHRLRIANLATLWSCTRTLRMDSPKQSNNFVPTHETGYIDLKADQKWWVLLLSMAGISADVCLMLELWSRSSFSQTAKISEATLKSWWATPVIIADESGHVTDVTSNTGSHWEQPVAQHVLASALEQAPRLKTSWCRVQKCHEKNTYCKMRPIREQWVCGHQLNCWRSFKNIIMIQNVGWAIAEPSLRLDLRNPDLANNIQLKYLLALFKHLQKIYMIYGKIRSK